MPATNTQYINLLLSWHPPYIKIRDFNGNALQATMKDRAFRGWNKYTPDAYVPPEPPGLQRNVLFFGAGF